MKRMVKLVKDYESKVFRKELNGLYTKISTGCREKGITIGELAKQLGMSKQNLYAQSKNGRLAYEYIKKIQEILEVELLPFEKKYTELDLFLKKQIDEATKKMADDMTKKIMERFDKE